MQIHDGRTRMQKETNLLSGTVKSWKEVPKFVNIVEMAWNRVKAPKFRSDNMDKGFFEWCFR